jgi:CRP/FNR family cyclic AMP-dependent transcriptional regulator
MKTLFQDDLLEAGYELPTSGLCYNLDTEDAKALISEGEWLLAEDELVAREGEEQQFLYLVVSGSVELSKRDDKGKQQSIASLTTGETFGEVAFLRGHIASATSETRGLCILWRITHDQLLDFIGSHGTIAGQLCLNLAGLLADRLLKENKLVSKVRMDLDDAISTLRDANDEDTVKTAALKELQAKVDNLNQATRVRRIPQSKRSKFNSISMTSLAVACIAVLAMVGLYSSYDHEAPAQVLALSDELESMKKNEAFYLELKKNIEAENQQLVIENSNFKQLGDSLSQELKSIKEQLSFRDYEYDTLKAKLIETEDELASLISIEQEAQKEDDLLAVDPSELYIPLVPQAFLDKVKDWTQLNSTLAFPCEVKVVNEPVTLSDLELTARVEVAVGGVLVATRFHPVSEEYIVARQGDSDTFMASVHINNTDIMEVLAQKYVAHKNSMGQKVENLFLSKRFSQLDKNFSEEK